MTVPSLRDSDFLARRLAKLQEEQALAARDLVAGGVNVTLSDRLVGYVLGLIADKHDSAAVDLKRLLDPAYDPLAGLYDALEAGPVSGETGDESVVCAGQEGDPTKHGFWYGSSSRHRPEPVLLFGLLRALIRATSR